MSPACPPSLLYYFTELLYKACVFLSSPRSDDRMVCLLVVEGIQSLGLIFLWKYLLDWIRCIVAGRD
jgi:hypothetical protein